MAIVLDDLLKTLSLTYLFTTYAHQPYVGAVYGRLAAMIDGSLKDPGTVPEDLAMEIQSGNVEALKILIEREKEQLRQAGIDVDRILSRVKRSRR